MTFCFDGFADKEGDAAGRSSAPQSNAAFTPTISLRRQEEHDHSPILKANILQNLTRAKLSEC
jgi:hypothetical protein